MKIIRIALISLFAITFIFSQSYAAPEKRIALVIGNSSYESSPLKNPANDAKDMADNLKSLGFQVILKTNASKKDMGKSIEDFGKQLKGRDVGMFFYAGHGIQVNGANYLIPVGAKISAESDIEYEAIDAGRVLATMHNAKSRVNIVILDACRDNPYARSFRTSTRGLAIIAKAPMGTIVSYSTSPGDVASDGTGRNSPFTSSLLQYMKQPGLTIEQVFKNTRQRLTKETNGKQVPWELSSLQGDFYFKSGKGIDATVASDATASSAEKLEASSAKTTDDELELALAKVQEKKFEEEQKQSVKEEMYRSLASDIKKYRSIKEASIDEKLKERAWEFLSKKYPQWAKLDAKKDYGIIEVALLEDKSGSLKSILKEEGISYFTETRRDGRFIAYDNGTVLDTKTNLMWAAKDNGSGLNWANAKSYCDSYRGGEYMDWRMPTQDELAGLYDAGKSRRITCYTSAQIHVATELIDIGCWYSWASETRGAEAATFDFIVGGRDWTPQSGDVGFNRVLPVRSGK